MKIKRPLFLITHSEAIGHFIRETEILNWMLEQKDYHRKYMIILCAQRRVSSRYFLEIIRDSFTVVPWPFGILTMKIMNRLSSRHRISNLEFAERRNEYMKQFHGKPSSLVSLSRREQLSAHVSKSHAELIGKKIVIVALRDEGYDLTINPNFDPESQSYRNIPLKSFNPLLSDLVSQGFTIIRAGRHNSQHLRDFNQNCLEISDLICDEKSLCDFAIFYLATLVITTGTGIDEIGILLRKPTIYLNVAPFGQIEQTEICKGILATNYFDGTSTKIPIHRLMELKLHLINPVPMIKNKAISLKPRDSEVMRRYTNLIISNMTEKSPFEMARMAGERNLGEYSGCVIY